MTPHTPDPESETDEMLMALADGELDDATAARLWDRIARDPGLSARFDGFVATAQMLREAWPPEPVPDHLIAAIMATPAAPDSVVAFRPRRRAAMGGPVGMALAASVLLAVGLGGFLAGRIDAPATPGAPSLVAAATALSAIPTGGQADLPDGGTARALASYQTDLGLCRLIETDADRGILCRDEAGPWALALAVSGGGADSYLPASDLGTGLIDIALDEMGAGAALDPAAEAALLDRP